MTAPQRTDWKTSPHMQQTLCHRVSRSVPMSQILAIADKCDKGESPFRTKFTRWTVTRQKGRLKLISPIKERLLPARRVQKRLKGVNKG